MATEIVVGFVKPLQTSTQVVVSTGLNLATNLTQLQDVDNYAGQFNKYARVKTDGTGIEWVDVENQVFGRNVIQFANGATYNTYVDNGKTKYPFLRINGKNFLPTVRDGIAFTITSETITDNGDGTIIVATSGGNKTFSSFDAYAVTHNIFETQITKQLGVFRYGNWSDVAGTQIVEGDELKGYEYPDDSGNLYAVGGTVNLPISRPASPEGDDRFYLATAVNVQRMRNEAASQLGRDYSIEWVSGISIPAGAMTNKLVYWHNEQFYSIGTDVGFTSTDFDVDLASGRFVSALVATNLQLINAENLIANPIINVYDGAEIIEGRAFIYNDTILIALKNTTWSSGLIRYIDYITLQDHKYRLDYIVDGWGAKGDATLSTIGYTGTDDTQAFKDAQIYIQDKFGVDNAEVSGGAVATLKLREGATYLVSGNHVMGNMTADGSKRENPIAYRFDNNGGTILWEPTATTDNFIDYAYCLYRPRIKIKVVVVGELNPNSFLKTNTFDGLNSFQEGDFDGSSVIAGTDPSTPSTYRSGKYIDTIFDIDGDILSDRCSVRNAKFQQWASIYKSSNPESVAWVMDGTSAWTWVDGASPIKITDTFSGSHTWSACDIVMAGNDQKIIVTTATDYQSYPNMGEITIDATRIEVRSGDKFTAVDVAHGRVVVHGLNCRNGNSNFNNRANFISAIVRNESEVKFIDSLIPSKALMQVIAPSQLSSFPRFDKSVGLILERCELQNDKFIYQPLSGSGNEISYRDVIQGDLLARNALVSKTAQNGYYGNCNFLLNNQITINGVTKKSGGNPQLDSSLHTSMPPFCFITDIGLYLPPNSPVKKIEIVVANSNMLTKDVNVGFNDMLDGYYGITSPSNTGAEIRLTPLDIGGVPLNNPQGDFTITYRTAKNKFEIGSSNNPELI